MSSKSDRSHTSFKSLPSKKKSSSSPSSPSLSTRAIREGPPTPLTPTDAFGLEGGDNDSVGMKRKMEQQRSFLARYFFDKIDAVKDKKLRYQESNSSLSVSGTLSRQSSIGSCASEMEVQSAEGGGGGAEGRPGLVGLGGVAGRGLKPSVACDCPGKKCGACGGCPEEKHCKCVECSCAPCRDLRRHQLIRDLNTKCRQELQAECIREQEDGVLKDAEAARRALRYRGGSDATSLSSHSSSSTASL